MKLRILTLLGAAGLALAQMGPQGPMVVSPEVSGERAVTFRILAPKAAAVTLQAGDIPAAQRGDGQLKKAENGVWEITTSPLRAGSYRYRFAVDGVPVVDPRNPLISESNSNVWSLVHVPGEEFQADSNVPHGAVSAVYYHSSVLGRTRRMHVYTPPGYELGKDKYPVFYLLHGAGDNDDAWSSVGRAGFILDNLIAAKKAKPMIVVMPAGHTSTSMNRGVLGGMEEFVDEFVKDILPYAEKNYRVTGTRPTRAVAGLSMGGRQTISIALRLPDKFAYVGVFSSGIFAAPRPGTAPNAQRPPIDPEFEEKNKAALENANFKKGLKLLWFATGKEDFLLKTTHATVDLFKKHGFEPVYRETEGAHTWLVWRDYLNEFTPQLFQ
ncbi:MAG: alpha/beta hydrolase-fold protein [Bryobacteraceae bacterium]|nr:alpha/beta hydrolase-fold protein [Bryobacteraceae bacterium]